MTTMSPEDAAALFGIAPQPAGSESTRTGDMAAEAALAAAEAALVAELATGIESGNAAADAPDSRTDLRVEVSWPARMQLPDGRIIVMKVRNVSERGVGLTSTEQIPARTVVNFEMAVPPLDEGGRMAAVKGTIETTYSAVCGSAVLCGGAWVHALPADLEPVKTWIKRRG